MRFYDLFNGIFGSVWCLVLGREPYGSVRAGQKSSTLLLVLSGVTITSGMFGVCKFSQFVNPLSPCICLG